MEHQERLGLQGEGGPEDRERRVAPVRADALTLGTTLRIGFEVELLAPRGRSRRDLADDLARRNGGEVVAVWHQDSEPSLVPGMGHFFHLSQGFEVRRPDGTQLCRLVDDITIADDLDPAARPDGSWHRLLTDDRRILQLLAEQSDPGGDLATSLDAVAELWGSQATRHGAAVRLDDRTGATVALATLQGGERERPCEVVTPPISHDHEAALEELLAPARELGFTVPLEAAVHLHLDGAPFRDPDRLAHVIRLFGHRRDELRELLGTNPRCRRLAPLPDELVAVADGTPSFDELRAAAGGLTKFFDVNLTQLFRDDPVRDTLEIRVLPGAVFAADIIERAALLEQLLMGG